MSIYIHPKNQEVLWTTIMKIPVIRDQHAKHPNQILFWFRNVLGMFYDKYKHVSLQVQDLQKLNRETVAYMVQSLQKNHSSLHANEPMAYYGTVGTVGADTSLFDNKTASRNYILEQKQSEFTHQLSERQKEYDQMLNRPAIKEIDFRVGATDAPLENIDALVEQHRKSREEIIQFVPGPTPTPPSAPVQMISPEPKVPSSLEEGVLQAFITETRQFMEQTRAFMMEQQAQSSPTIHKLPSSSRRTASF